VLRITTVDAHAAGQPLRLIVDGFPQVRGATMLDKCDWVARRADHVRRALMLEPRGHRDMYGAVLTEPVAPGSHAGILFMHADGYDPMSGHGVIAAATIAVERGLITTADRASAEAIGDRGAPTIVFDTPAGTVRTHVELTASDPATAPRVGSVAFVDVPSFVVHGGVDVPLANRRLRADVAFAGLFYAIVDGESAGLPLDGAHLPELRRAAAAIRAALTRTLTLVHPREARLEGLGGIIFTGPPESPAADLRSVAVFGGDAVDRSPCGGGTSAVLAVLDAMGLLDDSRPFVQEGLVGTTFSGRVTARTAVGEYAAIVPEIRGSAWITGEHTFVVHDDDPFREGFPL
jgi:proline racemase